MRFRYGIAVAGTHGKTTTTSLIASVLAEAGLDPTFVIGGRLASAGANAKLGAGEYLVAEADESDASFLHLQPMIAVVTNIDADHLGTYDGDLGRLKQAFIGFLHNLPFYGLAVLCRDDANTRELIPELGRRVVSYGFDEAADVRVMATEPHGLQTQFSVSLREHAEVHDFRLNLPGRHNVLNALAALAVALELGIEPAAVHAAFAKFSGIDRRLQVLGSVHTAVGMVTFVDDYGHHPTEIAATLAAARDAWPGRRIVVVFQPHRYSRTARLWRDFADSFSGADAVVLTDIYAAGEPPQPGVSGRLVLRAVLDAHPSLAVSYLPRRVDVVGHALDHTRPGDLVLTLGAGDLSTVPDEWLARAGARS
jgi:UDP-N-acetylmuramate--alanine ligase